MQNNFFKSLFSIAVFTGAFLFSQNFITPRFLILDDFDPISLPAQVIPTTGLVSHWAFDGNANDSVGTNNGTLVGGPTFVTGKIGSGLLLGNTKYVSVPSGVLGSGAYTISLWFKPNSNPPNNGHFTLFDAVSGGAYSQISWGQNYSTLPTARFLHRRQSSLQTIPSSNLSLGSWHHAVITFAGTNASTLAAYINGVSIGTQISYDEPFSPVITIGTDFDGAIDDIHIYNRALSAQEVLDIYNAASGTTPPPPPSPTPTPTPTPSPTPTPTSGTVLGNLAASLQPGSWAQLSTNNNSLLNDPDNLSPGNLLSYAISSVWDPSTRRLHFTGRGHAGGDTTKIMQWRYYDDVANSWQSGAIMPSIIGHAYDHLAFDPSGRMFYQYQYGSKTIWKYPLLAGGPWTSEAIPATGYVNINVGNEWFPGVGLAIYICGEPSGELMIRDLSGAWADIRGFGGSGGYHCFAEYSQVHNVIVFGGASGNPNQIWRLNSNKTITALTNAPLGLGIQQANVVADPVTGNFLIMGAGQFWELDPRGSGTWRQLSNTPPSAVGNPASPNLDSVISGGISNYGVVMYTTCRIQNCNVYLYRHAAGVGTTPPPAPTPTPTPTPLPTGSLTFAQKCAQAGVINCFAFDDPAQLYYAWPTGTPCDAVFAGRTNYGFGSTRIPPGNTVATVQNGQCVFPQIDSAFAKSGAGSIKFTIPSQSGSDSSGYFTEPFKRPNFPYIAPGSALGNIVYMQFHQWFDPNFLNASYQCGTSGTETCGGWKQLIWYGNPIKGSSASSIEVTHNNGWLYGIPTMYGQIGQDSYGYQDVRGCTFNFNGLNTYPEPPCIRYKANQWMEFTVRIEVNGAINSNSPASRVQLWVDGQLAIDKQNARINWGSNDGDGIGQFLMSPYHTRKYAGQVHPTGYTWYDDLIISTQPIQMGIATTPPLGDLNGDRIINSIDFSIMNSRWLTNDATSDLNKDGIVNSLDFSILNGNWLKTY